MKISSVLINTTRQGYANFIAALIVFVNLMVAATVQTPARAAGTNCITSTSISGTYTITPWITVPADGAAKSGGQIVTAATRQLGQIQVFPN